MGKLLSGLGLCLMLGSAQPIWAQDSFGFQRYEPSQGNSASSFEEVPPPQLEASSPIIQSIPMAQKDNVYNRKPMKSRAKNAHVRSARTPAQNYIYQRAVYHAEQRTQRMEQRKWKGESLLRPHNQSDHSGYYGYSVPVWHTLDRQ